MSKTYVFQPKGVCSRQFTFELEGTKIVSLDVVGGCNGNLKGISSLVKGKEIDEIINALEGITCGPRATSCPDQIAEALKQFKALSNDENKEDYL